MDEFERTLKDIEKGLDRMDDLEDKYKWEIVKYFDRIHDKLFYLNNIYIAGYLALIALKSNVPKSILIIPLANAILILFIEWLMLEASRRMSRLTKMPPEQINKEINKMNDINLFSLLVIFTTLIVTVSLFVFVYYYI